MCQSAQDPSPQTQASAVLHNADSNVSLVKSDYVTQVALVPFHSCDAHLPSFSGRHVGPTRVPDVGPGVF